MDLYNGDGKNNTYRGIPYYQRKLNDFAKGFAEGFNASMRRDISLEEARVETFFAFDPDNPAATITLYRV